MNFDSNSLAAEMRPALSRFQQARGFRVAYFFFFFCGFAGAAAF